MSNFALDTNSSPGDIVSSLNYALANLGTGTGANTANVLTANVTTGTITTNGNVVAYLYQYMNVAYGNSATGSGFTSNSYNTTYYGVHNNQANVADTNPADYQWTQVAGGFGTTKHLYYQTLGGRQINFNVNTTALPFYTAVQDNTPINLDIVTGTTGANGANGISTYYYPVYATGNTAPYTPVSINGTGNWNFGTKVGIPPLDPIYQNYPPISTFSINVPAGWTSYSNVINGYTYYTIFPANVNSQYGTGNLTITGNSAPVDIFTVGSGGVPSRAWTVGGTDLYVTGGNGGEVKFLSNVNLGTGTYNFNFTQPSYPALGSLPYPTWYGGNVAFAYANNVSVLSSLGGDTQYKGGYGNVTGGYGNLTTNSPSGTSNSNGGGGVADPWGVVTWAGQAAGNGLAFFGAGAGGGYYNYPTSINGSGGLGGGGSIDPAATSTPTALNYGLAGSGGGGAGLFSYRPSGGTPPLYTNGSGVIIIRKYPDQSLYTPTTWSNLQPNTGSISSNTVVWVSSALATSNIATGNATSLSWSTPAQLSGNSGISTFAFTCYTLANAQPATPTSNTGSWNFNTGTGVAPSDPNGNPSITFSTDAAITQSVNSIGLYNYYTLYPASPSSPALTTLTISNTVSTLMDVFMVGPGGAAGTVSSSGTGIITYKKNGGNGGEVVYQPNVAFSNNTYNLSWLNSPNTTNYNINLGGNILIRANANTGAAGGTVVGGSASSGAYGVADPYNVVTWVGQPYNGVNWFGGGGGASLLQVNTGGTSTSYVYSSNGAGGIGGGGAGLAFFNNASPGNSATDGLVGSGGGGGGYIENYIGQGQGGQSGPGVMIFRQKIPVTWSTQQPTSTTTAQVWSSTAYITTDNRYAGNVAAVTWSTPVQVNSSRGVFTSAYVVTPSDPTFYTAAQFTANFSAPRTNANPPIGTGYSPITGDTATFTYRPTNTVVTKTFYANINQWLSANTQVISGNLFVSNSITASALITTDVYPINITSQNATIGSYASPGFWLQSNTGNARFAGTTSIGNSLSVGNNAVIGNSLLIGNNVVIGNNGTIGSNLVVGTNASIGNNLIVGNNALVGNNLVIGDNLFVGNNASIASNLIVGNNAVIGGNLTILGLVSGGNLKGNVVNNVNINFGAVQSNQIGTAAILARMFTSGCVPASALTPGASTRVLTIASTYDGAAAPPTSGTYYNVGNSLVASMKVGDVIYITAQVYAQLSFFGAATGDNEYAINLQVGIQLPDSSVQYSETGSAFYYTPNSILTNVLNFDAATVSFGFTATQTGTHTFAMGYGYADILAGNTPPDFLNLNYNGDVAYTYPAIITGILAPYVG